jgi:D-alanyl-D-alanine carboxypeptidase
MIAEQVTGSTVEQLIRDRFVLPYFLSGTSFPADAAMPDPHMSGYAPATSDQPMLDATESQPGISWAAGAMISNLDDMHTWVELLTDGSLLTPELQTQRMQQIIPMAEGSPIQYGLGLMELFGFYGHNGGIAGYSSIMLRDPDDGATFVAVTNLSDEHGGGADTIALGLIQLLLPERIPAAAAPPVASPAASPVS